MLILLASTTAQANTLDDYTSIGFKQDVNGKVTPVAYYGVCAFTTKDVKGEWYFDIEAWAKKNGSNHIDAVGYAYKHDELEDLFEVLADEFPECTGDAIVTFTDEDPFPNNGKE